MLVGLYVEYGADVEYGDDPKPEVYGDGAPGYSEVDGPGGYWPGLE